MNYDLLRPFDLEAAKRGELVCEKHYPECCSVILSANAKGEVVIDWPAEGFVIYSNKSNLRMAPLCWVEGKPVYKGDVLYMKVPEPRTGSVVTAEFPQDDDTISTFRSANGAVPKIRHDQLTWTPPKVKREIKLLAFLNGQGYLCRIREDMFRENGPRVPSEDKVIEVEE